MHLTEAEIRVAIQMDNQAGHYEGDYAFIKAGDTLTVSCEPESDEEPFSCKLRLFNVEGGVTTQVDDDHIKTGEVTDSFRDSPPCKMFEAVIRECEGMDPSPGDEVFGLLFPSGLAIVVDSGPEDEYTNRRIRAGCALMEVDKN
jgi:hypothetical protein